MGVQVISKAEEEAERIAAKVNAGGTWATKDSGEREVFDTGAQRDTQTGKPRYDLVPSHALKRVAELYARGAEKYNDNNWHKGITYSRCLASLERHLHQWKQGERDEDHLAAVVWNALAIMHYEECGPAGLDDLPRFSRSKDWDETKIPANENA